jgi:hypothetical protein
MLQIPAFYFDREFLDSVARERGSEFKDAHPFPHLVLSSFLPEDVIQRLVSEFPAPDDIPWKVWGGGRTRRLEETKLNKLGQSDEQCFGPFTRHFVSQLLSATFLSFLERLTGIGSLVVDPSLNGCGLHSTGSGGRLMIHTDTNRHPHSRHALHQALNLILFLNEDWKEEYGGHLELWTRDRKPCKQILPVANRVVLFQSDTRSFHGHPRPVTAPDGRRRNSISVYYYSVGRDADENYDGMQKRVRWVPTSRADWEFAAESVQRLGRLITRLHGVKVRFPARMCPFALPSDAPSHLLLTLCDWPQLDEGTRQQLEQTHASRLQVAAPYGEAAVKGGDAEATKPFAYLSHSESSGLSAPDTLLLLHDEVEGTMHYAHPETGRKMFAGYVDDIINIVSAAGYSNQP